MDRPLSSLVGVCAAFGILALSSNLLAHEISDPSAALLRNNWVDGPSQRVDSGVKYETYEKMEKDLSALAARHPQRAKLIRYGKSIRGRNLNVLRIEDSQTDLSAVNRPAIEISGAIHGNEFLGIEDKLAHHFLENRGDMPGLSLFLALGGVVYVIPVVNPDGYASRGRGNAKGVDLNRDFDVIPTASKKFSQVETQALRNYLDGDLKANRLNLRFALDYHCCVPALITPWTYIDAYPSQDDLATYAEFTHLQTTTLGYPFGNAVDTVSYTAVGSSIDYLYAQYGTAAFTIEGEYGGENLRLQKHLRFIDGVFDRLTTAKDLAKQD